MSKLAVTVLIGVSLMVALSQSIIIYGYSMHNNLLQKALTKCMKSNRLPLYHIPLKPIPFPILPIQPRKSNAKPVPSNPYDINWEIQLDNIKYL